jgi:hypothetical protein
MYNSLVAFSKTTLDPKLPCPILVTFKKEDNQVIFEQGGLSIRSVLPLYYCLGLDSLKSTTYLLPGDYDYLMSTLQSLISGGSLLEDRTCLSPENYGFDIYGVDLRKFNRGPGIIGKIRIVSGTSWIFKTYVKIKYRKCLN